MIGIDSRLTRFVMVLAGMSALLVALLVPATYFYSAFRSQAAELATIAALKQVLVEQIVSADPDSWTTRTERLDEVLATHLNHKIGSHVRLLDRHGAVAVEHGAVSSWPRIEVRLPVAMAGATVGTLVIAHSYRNLLWETLFVALAGLLVAGLVFFLLRKWPQRILESVYRELHAEIERAQVTLYSIGDAVISTDREQRIERMNRTAEELTGWCLDEARGQRVDAVFRVVDDKTGDEVADPLKQTDADVVAVTGYLSLRRRDGSLIPIEHNAAPVVVEGGRFVGTVLVFRDVTKAREMSRRLSWQARHDSLTGLYNRTEFEHRLDNALENYRQTRRSFVVLYLDLDRFKIVNDSAGHLAGDELLRQIGAIIDQPMRGSDVLARLGGDEFGALLLGCPLERAGQIADSIIAGVGNHRLRWEGKVFTVGVSIGVVEVAPEFRDAEDLLAAANSACYASKQEGRNRASVYQSSDATIQRHRFETDWTQQLIQAIAEDRLRIYFQEYRSATDAPGASSGPRQIEVLLRMLDVHGNVLLPGSFLPAAERHDLMPRVDLWVIEATFKRQAEIAARFGADAVCSINLSGQTASDPRLPEQIRSLARQYGVRPQSIVFELAETEVLNRLRVCSELMMALSGDGFRFALDDFGGGIGAFSYLRNLPVSLVKIDGAYVRDTAASEISQVMVAAINDIGHVMGVRTIAKSVDSDRVLTEIRSIGVDYVQGYLLHRPEPLDTETTPRLPVGGAV